MHADGNAFKFLWPEAPLFNGYATIALGSGIILFGSVYSMLFLQTSRYHPALDKLLAATIALTIGMLASSIFVDHQILKKALVLIAFLAILLFVVSGLVAARRRFKQVRFYLIAWMGAVLSSAIMTGRHWFGMEISEEVQFDSMRIVIVSDAALMGLAIWDYFNQLRQARQQALQSSLDQTLRSLQLSQRLQDLEQQYAMARTLAKTQEQKISDMLHDLNQPLHALRLSVRNLVAGGADAESSTRIEGTFAYLEKLVAEHLDRSAPGLDGDGDRHEADDVVDALGVREVLRGIHEMFLPDARAKGLRFTLVETSAEIGCEPLVLMRIVSNLVANAIKYTEKGAILLGCRRADDALRIEVHDTGPGMSAEEFGRVKNRAVRLDRDMESKEGKGLGLSIAHMLARSRGYSLTLSHMRKNGTGIVLTMAAMRKDARTSHRAANEISSFHGGVSRSG
jgi:signal transduction histidine kinase